MNKITFSLPVMFFDSLKEAIRDINRNDYKNGGSGLHLIKKISQPEKNNIIVEIVSEDVFLLFLLGRTYQSKIEEL